MANEKRLIDLWGVNMDEVDTSDCTDVDDILSAVITYLSELPTVDAVEVVRCKDCIYRHTRPSCQGRRLDWYCPDGEKRADHGR